MLNISWMAISYRHDNHNDNDNEWFITPKYYAILGYNLEKINSS